MAAKKNPPSAEAPPTTVTGELVTCNACHRAGPDGAQIIRECGSHVTCPKSVHPVDPIKDAVLGCSCGAKSVSIPVSRIMSGKSTDVGHQCPRSLESCQATLVFASAIPE